MIEPKILLYDIETAHNIVGAFDLFNKRPIPYQGIVQERHMLCASWKWLGESDVYYISQTDDKKTFKKDPGNDRIVIQHLRDAIEEADAIVAHYGDKFDHPYLLTRMAKYRIDPLPKVKQIDTYKIARRLFKFNSNRLDYLGQFLGVGRKLYTPPGLWERCREGSIKAYNQMIDYNIEDVLLLERVYKVLAPYAPNTMSVVNRARDGDWCCAKCGSEDIQKRGYDYSRAVGTYHRIFCNSCRGWSQVPVGENKVIR